MDGNKDAAQKCFDIGKRALKDGEKVRAHKFLSKALRLDPTLPLESLVSSLASEIGDQDTDIPSGGKTVDRDSIPKASSSGECNGDASPSTAEEYTVEQVEIVRRIRRTRDYYQILGLEKDCSAEEVKKAYRKVSLKVHPDKNKAPGAEEAFKAVSKAFACLNEPELRQRYDQYGPEEGHDVARQQAFRQRQRNGFVYEDMFDADEIFNSFFYGTAYGTQRAHFVRNFRTGGHQGGTHMHTRDSQFASWFGVLQLVSILLVFLLSYFPFSKPVYSLVPSAQYEIKYLTKAHSVPFFVRSHEFEKDYPLDSQARNNIEYRVESEYVENLRYNCHREYSWKQFNPLVKTPNCDALRQFVS